MSNPVYDKARYDLAIAYAKISLENAIADGSAYDGVSPDEISALEYLMSKFASAYGYYTKCICDEQIESCISES